jgi:glycosyltransferase involved in cell wall biosynthesis
MSEAAPPVRGPRQDRGKVSDRDEALTCSVVVATYNRAPGLRALLEALADQDIAPDRFEVVVVDDGSADETWEVLTRSKTPYRLKALRQLNQGPAAARNVAILAAEGDVIVTLDDDVTPARDLLRRHLEAHAREPDVAVIGRMSWSRDVAHKPWVKWEESGLLRQYESMLSGEWAPTQRQFYTANASVRRQAIIDAGLFDPAFRRAEDVELAYRLRDNNLRFRFLPDAVIHHRPNRTYAAWLNVAQKYGDYDIVMWREKGRENILRNIQFELGRRHLLTRSAVRLIVGFRLPVRLFTLLASGFGLATARVGLERLSQFCYSFIYNLHYYSAAATALERYGIDRSQLFNAAAANRTPVEPARHHS